MTDIKLVGPRIGTCPHCHSDLVLSDRDCGEDYERTPETPEGVSPPDPCPFPGLPHKVALCCNPECPHPDAAHVMVEALLGEGIMIEPIAAWQAANEAGQHPEGQIYVAEPEPVPAATD